MVQLAVRPTQLVGADTKVQEVGILSAKIWGQTQNPHKINFFTPTIEALPFFFRSFAPVDFRLSLGFGMATDILMGGNNAGLLDSLTISNHKSKRWAQKYIVIKSPK